MRYLEWVKCMLRLTWRNFTLPFKKYYMNIAKYTKKEALLKVSWKLKIFNATWNYINTKVAINYQGGTYI